MTLKVCGEPGCPELQAEPRCLAHRRAREHQRGTRQARGYGADHDAERARWAPIVATGHVRCWRCRDYIVGEFDLGHDDCNRGKYRGPEHPACNRATAGRISPDA